MRDAVLLNAAAALVAAGPSADGSLTSRLASALDEAAVSLESGAAGAALERWITVSQSLKSSTA